MKAQYLFAVKFGSSICHVKNTASLGHTENCC